MTGMAHTAPPHGRLRERLARLGAALEGRAPAIAALVALAAGVATITTDRIGVFHDDGVYLLIARALAEGQGFVYPQLPGAPAAIHYPPAWPLLLSLVWRVAPSFPDSVGWFKLLNPLILSAAAAGMTIAARRLFGWPGWAALLATLVALVSLPVLILTTFLLSEPLFIALLFPAVLLAERMRRDDSPGVAALAGVMTALLMLTRSIGIVVLIAALAVLVLDRRWRTAAVFGAVTVALVMPWQLYVWASSPGFPPELRGSYGPYLEWIVSGYREGGWELFLASVGLNLRRLLGFAGSLVAPWAPATARGVAGILLIGFVGAAGVTLWAKDCGRVLVLALLGYLGIAVLWPFHIDRFLWAAWPMLVLVSLAGWHLLAATLAARASGAARGAARAVAVAAALVVGTHEFFTVRGLATSWSEQVSAERTAFGVLLTRALDHEPRLAGRTVVAELAPLVALYSGGIVLPNEILTVRQHVHGKTATEHREELEAIDARFRPDAYVVMRGGPYLKALGTAELPDGRSLRDVSPPPSFVRILMVEAP